MANDIELDEKFGILVHPTAIKRHENNQTLTAAYTLDDETAEILRLFIEPALTGHKLFDFLFRRLVILWIVTETGDIRFCLEEVCETDRPDARYPRIRGMAPNDSITPLGHPTLVSGGDGRIAGEIVLDRDDDDSPVWTINNKSARYGVHPSRDPIQLENVAAEFETYGIFLTTAYIGPRRQV